MNQDFPVVIPILTNLSEDAISNVVLNDGTVVYFKHRNVIMYGEETRDKSFILTAEDKIIMNTQSTYLLIDEEKIQFRVKNKT